jgi:hypothetical protein
VSLDINYPDKILAGVNQSYTVTSDEGPPQGTIAIDGKDLPHRLIPLGPPKDALVSTTPVMKYKVTFYLPADSTGKNVTLRFQAGASRVDDSKAITAA